MIKLSGASIGLSTILLLTACASAPPDRQTPSEPLAAEPQTSSPTAPFAAPAKQNKQNRPATLTTTLSVEGEATQITLHRFDAAALPFTTYVPNRDFTPAIDRDPDGQGVRFNFSPTGTSDPTAYIHIFFPTDAPAPEEMAAQLTGAQGLLAANQWKILDRSPTTEYAWAHEMITYQHTTPEETVVGTIFVGDDRGKGFMVLTHYPAEYGDGFEPRAAIVLRHFELRS